MKVRKIDHVGIVVNDLAAAKAFFLELGFELQGEAIVEGEWVGNVIGLRDVRDALAMLRTPDGDCSIELIQFFSPVSEKEPHLPLSNTLGIRHITLAVDDIEAAVAKLTKRGAELMGTIHNYQDTYKVCYIRGPEGIILELGEELKR